MPEENN